MIIPSIHGEKRTELSTVLGGGGGRGASSVPAMLGRTEDVVSFSEAARQLAEKQKAEKAAAHGLENSGKNGITLESAASLRQAKAEFEEYAEIKNVVDEIGEAIRTMGSSSDSGAAASSESPGAASATNIEALQRQVENAQKQARQAQQALEQALATARSDPALTSEDDSPDVKNARTVVTEMENKVRQLQEQLNQAMREACGAGGGGGGQIAGTRAGGGTGIKAVNIGTGTDPFAAARAAEQGELGGGSAVDVTA